MNIHENVLIYIYTLNIFYVIIIKGVRDVESPFREPLQSFGLNNFTVNYGISSVVYLLSFVDIKLEASGMYRCNFKYSYHTKNGNEVIRGETTKKYEGNNFTMTVLGNAAIYSS